METKNVKRREWSSRLNSAETPRVVKAENVNCMGDVKVSSDLRQSAFKGMDLQHFLWWDVTLWGVDT